MVRALSILVIVAVAGSLGASAVPFSPSEAAQGQTVDRIVARVEGDIILLSEMRELAAYQQLIDGHSQPLMELVNALVEQWVVRMEAQEASFPAVPAADVDAEVKRIQSTFADAQAYRERLVAAGLTAEALRRMVGQQLYLERYLDYKFRPAVQVSDEEIAKYYEDDLAPALRSRGETVPPLDQVTDRIREVLVQRGITEQANTWFDETKSRLQIEIDFSPATEGKR
jgi:hypothetical protein